MRSFSLSPAFFSLSTLDPSHSYLVPLDTKRSADITPRPKRVLNHSWSRAPSRSVRMVFDVSPRSRFLLFCSRSCGSRVPPIFTLGNSVLPGEPICVHLWDSVHLYVA